MIDPFPFSLLIWFNFQQIMKTEVFIPHFFIKTTLLIQYPQIGLASIHQLACRERLLTPHCQISIRWFANG